MAGPQWFEGPFEGDTGGGTAGRKRLVVTAIEPAHHFRSSWTRMGSCPAILFDVPLDVEAGFARFPPSLKVGRKID